MAIPKLCPLLCVVMGTIVVTLSYMRKCIPIWILVLLFKLPVFAQEDSTEYEYGLPVTEDDTARNFPSVDLYPPANLKRLIPPQLPRRVLRALTRESQYKGWETGELYYDRNTDRYLIQIPRDDDMYVYTLSPEGKPVAINVYRKKE